eukprot:6212733-Pleurochrysis_carterae.AAC.2
MPSGDEKSCWLRGAEVKGSEGGRGVDRRRGRSIDGRVGRRLRRCVGTRADGLYGPRDGNGKRHSSGSRLRLCERRVRRGPQRGNGFGDCVIHVGRVRGMPRRRPSVIVSDPTVLVCVRSVGAVQRVEISQLWCKTRRNEKGSKFLRSGAQCALGECYAR